MIFEMRTYLMKPGSIPRVEELFGAGLPARARLSRFGGFWRTEVGTLNQIIHVWPYKDVNERDHIRAEAIRTGVWPPKIADNILEMESKILHAAPFSPHFEPGEHGGLYEFRTYTYGPGAIPKVIEAWTPLIKARSAISPLIFAGFTDAGLDAVVRYPADSPDMDEHVTQELLKAVESEPKLQTSGPASANLKLRTDLSAS